TTSVGRGLTIPFTRMGTPLRSVPTSEGDVKLWAYSVDITPNLETHVIPPNTTQFKVHQF
ncbi:MAG: hypothetical protein ABRQ34_12150, partial [Smithellaceae bacterium]